MNRWTFIVVGVLLVLLIISLMVSSKGKRNKPTTNTISMGRPGLRAVGASRNPAVVRRQVDDDDDGFVESLVIGAATGVPIGRNPAGALLGASLHDDGESRHHSSPSSSAGSAVDSDRHDHHRDTYNDSSSDSGDSSGGDGGGGD
jgi:hypothetical protein